MLGTNFSGSEPLQPGEEVKGNKEGGGTEMRRGNEEEGGEEIRLETGQE